MMRLIDADEFIKEINNRCESAIKWGINGIADHNEEIKIRAEQAIATFCEASLTAKKMPTIDAEPVRHGKWIVCKGSNGKDYRKCSECLHTQEITGLLNYCPVCGARMDAENDSAEEC